MTIQNASNVVALMMVFTLTLPVSAQSNNAERAGASGQPLTLAILEQDDQAKSAAVMKRRVGPKGIDVIVLPADASPEQLLTSVLAFRQAQFDNRNKAPQTVSFRVTAPSSRGTRSMNSAELARARRTLDRLKAARPAHLAGVGFARSRVVYVPPATRAVVKAVNDPRP